MHDSNGRTSDSGSLSSTARGAHARRWPPRHTRPARPPGRAAGRCVHPHVEELEPRALPSTTTPWYPSLMAFENYDSGRTHVFDQATFGGSLTGVNTVTSLTSPDSFPAGYNAVYENAQQIFVYGGADPSQTYGTGSYVARLDPTTLTTVWKTQLANVTGTANWNWPGSLSILSDGSLVAIYGCSIARLDPGTGQVTAQATLPTGGWYTGDTVYNGLSGFADGTLVAKTIYRPHMGQLPPTQSVVVAINSTTLQVLSQVTIPDLCGGRISATSYNDQNYAYVAGNTSVYRLWWSAGQLTVDTSWSPGNIYLPGQTGASAPVIMGDWVLFQTDAQASTAPMNVWAISQANASIRYTVQPFLPYPLLTGRLHVDPSSVSADPASGLVYAADWGTGYIGALLVTSHGLQVMWTAPQSTTEHLALVGPSNQRVLVSTSGFSAQGTSTDRVVWRNAATGQVLAVSGTLPGVLRGIMVQPYYNGDVLYLADNGSLVQLAPAARQNQRQVLGPQLVLAADRPAATVAAVIPEARDRSVGSRAAVECSSVRPPASVGAPLSAAPEFALPHDRARALLPDGLDRLFADLGTPAPWWSADW